MSSGLRAPTFAESIAIDNYKAATGAALTSADAVSDKVVTAAFSVATAFGAIVALVAPKDSAPGLLLALPFLLLAVAVGLALWAESIAVPINLQNDLGTVKTNVENTVKSKRNWSRGALIMLAVGMLAAGLVLVDRYRAPAKTEAAQVSVWLTPAGTKAVAKVCGAAVPTPLTGTVSGPSGLTSDRVELTPTAGTCGAGRRTLVIQQKEIALASRATSG
jgi:hypothetical protein